MVSAFHSENLITINEFRPHFVTSVRTQCRFDLGDGIPIPFGGSDQCIYTLFLLLINLKIHLLQKEEDANECAASKFTLWFFSSLTRCVRHPNFQDGSTEILAVIKL